MEEMPFAGLCVVVHIIAQLPFQIEKKRKSKSS